MAFATVGDLAKARYVRRIREAAHEKERSTGRPGMDHWSIRARLETLQGRHDAAEALLLQNGAVEDAIALHRGMGRWEDAIRVAERYGHPEGNRLKKTYREWLLETRQEDKAARLHEQDGDHLAAISMYLRGGFPAQAARLIMDMDRRGKAIGEPKLVDKVSDALRRAGMHRVAGEFLRHQGDLDAALEELRKGRCFEEAVGLARASFPHMVADVENEWGEWHAQNRQWEAAVNHFIEAQNYDRAIDAAILARQWTKAIAFANTTLRGDPSRAATVYKRVSGSLVDWGVVPAVVRLHPEDSLDRPALQKEPHRRPSCPTKGHVRGMCDREGGVRMGCNN